MEVSSELLFFFSALGAFNGFLLGIYYSFFRKPKHISNFFLGGFLICLSIRIGKSVIFYFNDDLAFPFLQFGLTACCFIGPFLYFYFKSIYANTGNIRRTWKWHMAVIIPVVLFINFKYPFETNIDLWRPTIINGIYSIWIIYTLLALPSLWKLIKPAISGKSKLGAQGWWDVSIYIGNVMIWAAFFFVGFTSYILGALLFSFMFYLMIMLLIFRKREDFSATRQTEKYLNKKIDNQKAREIINRVESHLKKESRFTNPNVKLAEVAKALNILPHTLSQVLNDNLGKNFPQFLNEFRIEKAKKMLLENENLTQESIGYDCGFNSKSTFYSTFKKITGITPSAFRKAEKPQQ